MTTQSAGWKRRFWACGLALTLALVTAGCDSATGTVSGKVSYEGVPLRGGTVTFTTEDGKSTTTARIQPDGSYTAENVEVGPNYVGVETRSAREEPSAGLSHGRHVPIPVNYANPRKSGLRMTVWGGPQTHPIDLK